MRSKSRSCGLARRRLFDLSCKRFSCKGANVGGCAELCRISCAISLCNVSVQFVLCKLPAQFLWCNLSCANCLCKFACHSAQCKFSVIVPVSLILEGLLRSAQSKDTSRTLKNSGPHCPLILVCSLARSKDELLLG